MCTVFSVPGTLLNFTELIYPHDSYTLLLLLLLLLLLFPFYRLGNRDTERLNTLPKVLYSKMEEYEFEPGWTLGFAFSRLASFNPLNNPTCSLQMRRGGSWKQAASLKSLG